RPTKANRIDCRAQRAIAQAVFSLTAATRPMINRDLHKPVACAFDQRGNETMHSFERNQRANAFAPHRFKRTTGVAHSVFCETAANRVSNPAGQPLHKCVTPLRAIATDEIGTARNFGEWSWNVSRISLQIADDKNRSQDLRGLETGMDSTALPGIRLKPNHP